MNLADFFHMGGYAFYVWTSYALTALVLIANLVAPLAAGRRTRRELIGSLKRAGKL